jgi:hypothetical protein
VAFFIALGGGARRAVLSYPTRAPAQPLLITLRSSGGFADCRRQFIG